MRKEPTLQNQGNQAFSSATNRKSARNGSKSFLFGAHSLQRAMLVLTLTHPNADLIKQRISSFSEGFEDIKQERRYEILAHLQEGLMDALNLTYDVGPAIRIIA